MNDPRILLLFGLVFAALSGYNLYIGRRRLLVLRARGQTLPWYKQLNLLTGLEYLLLMLVFLLNTASRSWKLPTNVASYLFGISMILLLASVALAFMVIRQGFSSSRRQAVAADAGSAAEQSEQGTPGQEVDPAVAAERRRERRRRRLEHRRRMARERRRRAGKA
jgi:hypothetical protein